MTETNTKATYTTKIRWSGKDFGKAVNYAKRLDGVYDPSAKTWTVTVWCSEGFDADAEMLRCKGMTIVDQPASVVFS